MTDQEWIEKLQQEGFTDVGVCPLPPTSETPAHTHDAHTVHIILTGELIITDQSGVHTFRPGDRVEFTAGTTHHARGTIDAGTMISGVKQGK